MKIIIFKKIFVQLRKFRQSANVFVFSSIAAQTFVVSLVIIWWHSAAATKKTIIHLFGNRTNNFFFSVGYSVFDYSIACIAKDKHAFMGNKDDETKTFSHPYFCVFSVSITSETIGWVRI